MADTKLESKFWTDEKFKSNSTSDEVKLCYLYLTSSPHKNILGFYYLPLGYLAADLGWSMEKTNEVMRQLIEMKRIYYDFDACVVLVINFLKHNCVQNPKQTTHGLQKLDELPQNQFFSEFEIIIKEYYKPCMQPLLKRLHERLGKQVEVKEEVAVEGEVEVKITPEKYFMDTVNPMPNNAVFEDMKYYIELGVKEDLIIKAIDIAISKDKRNWNYMSGIIQNWVNANILTLEQYEQSQKKYTNPQNNYQNKLDKLDDIKRELGGDEINDSG